MASEEDKGARPKRGIAPVDYKKLHEGAGLDDARGGYLIFFVVGMCRWEV